MPRSWHTHWPLPPDTVAADRDGQLDVLGNLTLLTGRLNRKISNGPWAGTSGKRAALTAHDVLKLNRDLIGGTDEVWDEQDVADRTGHLIDDISEIWRVPTGHKSAVASIDSRPKRKIEVSDLLGAGQLEVGAQLYARPKQFSTRTATVLPDGSLEVDGVSYAAPSGAARAVSGVNRNGWWFWLVDPASRRSLSDLWHEYVEQRAVDVDDDDAPDEEEDD
jgi:hypothetical protein